MARPTASRKMHAVNPRQSMDHFALILAFVVGVGGGVLLKNLGMSPFVAAGFSTAVLVAYAGFAYFATQLRLEPETVGDNCYYLGFLFTLTSLAVTLYEVAATTGQGGNSADLLPGVISGFGVALASTIVGVFLRVMLMQVRLDVVAREREMRLELNDATRDFRMVLAQSIGQVKAFTTESLQQSAERDERLRTSTETLLTDTRAQLIAASTAFSDAIRISVSEHSKAAVGAISASVAAASDAAVKTISHSLEELAGSAEQLSRSNHRAASELQAILTEVKVKGEQVQVATSAVASSLETASGSVTASSHDLAESVAKTSKDLSRAMVDAEHLIGSATLALSGALVAAAEATRERISITSAPFSRMPASGPPTIGPATPKDRT